MIDENFRKSNLKSVLIDPASYIKVLYYYIRRPHIGKSFVRGTRHKMLPYP